MGQFPYPKGGSVQKQGGEHIADVLLDVWALGSTRTTSAGKTYDWEGVAPTSAQDALAGSNRQVVIDGQTFRVVSVVGLDAPLDHLELRLLRVGAAGGKAAA